MIHLESVSSGRSLSIIFLFFFFPRLKLHEPLIFRKFAREGREKNYAKWRRASRGFFFFFLPGLAVLRGRIFFFLSRYTRGVEKKWNKTRKKRGEGEEKKKIRALEYKARSTWLYNSNIITRRESRRAMYFVNVIYCLLKIVKNVVA